MPAAREMSESREHMGDRVGSMVPPAKGIRAGILALLTAGILCAIAPPAARAQAEATDPAVDPPPLFGWLEAWSPLAEVGDLPRYLPEADYVLPDPLLRPMPRVGLFWTGGNPAGLADEVRESRAEFVAGYSKRNGDYRRPLDPSQADFTGAGGLAWGPLGANGAGIGRVAAGGSGRDVAHADVIQPYASAPMAILDTIGATRNRTSARVEGAGGWRLGKVTFGLGLGYMAHKMETDASPVPVSTRSTRPGVTAGVAYGEPGGLRVGAHVRWQQATHDVTVFSVAAPSRVYELLGFDEPVPLNLSATFYDQRMEEESWAAGGSLAGTVSQIRWAVFGQVEGHETRRFDNGSNDPVVDRWEADGVSVGLAGRRGLWEDAEAVVELRYRSVDGGARKPSLDDDVFTGEESRVSAAGELRFALSQRWAAAGRLALVRENRTRRDRLLGVGTEVSAWETGLGASLVRRLAGRGQIGGAVSLSHYVPTAAIPSSGVMGPVYEQWMAPEVLLTAVEAWSWAGRLGARIPLSGNADLLLRGSYGSASPGEVGGGAIIQSLPEGNRRRWELSVGAVIE